MKGAIFVDRDGTINAHAGPHKYVTAREQFQFLPGALDALAFLAQNSERRIVIVTNQSPIGRGLVTREQVDVLHRWMVRAIDYAGGRVDGVYVCPHEPDVGCPCRKPKPGLILHAAQEMEIDRFQSCLVGDTAGDLRAGWAAGVDECYMVLTGQAPKEYPEEIGHEVYADLEAAAHAIVRKERA